MSSSVTSSPISTNKNFESGAVRSIDADEVRYDLICTTGLNLVAATYAEGAKKYAIDNWAKGMPIGDTLNHAMRHIEFFRQGDTSENHLGHAIWNLMAVAHFNSNCQCHLARAIHAQRDKLYVNEPR